MHWFVTFLEQKVNTQLLISIVHVHSWKANWFVFIGNLITFMLVWTWRAKWINPPPPPENESVNVTLVCAQTYESTLCSMPIVQYKFSTYLTYFQLLLSDWLTTTQNVWINYISLRGTAPKPKLRACFVHYLKIMKTFLKSDTIFLKQTV